MATHDYVLANQSGSSFRTDLNNALAAVVSNNSNATEPSTKYAYELWADTNSGYLKIRNAANNAWVQLFKLDGTLSDIPVEGTVIKSTGESGGTKFLREDGDNSCSWQSISQTALTGSTNNTVCTVTGANAIQGEANLIFDGTNLGVGVTPSTFSLGNAVQIEGAGVGLWGENTSTLHLFSNAYYNSGYKYGVTAPAGQYQMYQNTHTWSIAASGSADAAITWQEALRVETSGNVKVSDGDLVIGTAGHGIDFSANSHAGGMTSELLDSYEEGTFVPTLGGFTSISYTTQSGRYTKIGNLVNFQIFIQIASATGAASQLQMGNLPFTSSNTSNSNGGGYKVIENGFMDGSGNFSTKVDSSWWIPANNVYLQAYENKTGYGIYGNATSLGTGGTNKYILLQGSYIVD